MRAPEPSSVCFNCELPPTLLKLEYFAEEDSTQVADFSVTDQKQAEYVADLVSMLIEPKDAVLTDGCACCGGNAIAFAKRFKKVYAYELEQSRVDMLRNNVDVLGLRNVKVFCTDYTAALQTQLDGKAASYGDDGCLPEPSEVVFFDPPWGGKNYGRSDSLPLHLSDKLIEDICVDVSRLPSAPTLQLLKVCAFFIEF